MIKIFARRKVLETITNMIMRCICVFVNFKHPYYNVDIKDLYKKKKKNTRNY